LSRCPWTICSRNATRRRTGACASAICFEEAKREDIILFIDEGHRICGSGGSDNLANTAKPYLTSEKLQVILATTTDEFKKYIEQDSAVRRRFEKVRLDEPDAEETEKILNKLLSERYPNVKAESGVLRRLIEIGNRYCRDRNNPDKSISLLDHTISWMKNNKAGLIITNNCIVKAMSLRLKISEGALELDMRTALKKLSARLSEKFVGWDSQMDKLAEPLSDALIKSVRPGPLCAVMLTGADAELLKEIAKEAAMGMGFIGKDEINAVSTADYAASAVDADIYDDPARSPHAEQSTYGNDCRGFGQGRF
jgi:ATP-dependent Clp protease ATP-binding subunit ClpA